MIISGGVNIYPAEVEAALLGIGGVRDCAVFGIPDPEFGEAVCAYVEPDEEATLDAAGIQRSLAGSLSRSKIPKVVRFETHQIGRAHVWTPVTNAHLVCRLLLDKQHLRKQ